MNQTINASTTITSFAKARSNCDRSHADIIVAETINDKSVASLAGQAGGVGWGNSWSAFSGVNVSQGGLNYNKGAVFVSGIDKKLSLNSPADGCSLSRQFSQSTPGTTHICMLFQAATPPDRNRDTVLIFINNDLGSNDSSRFRMNSSDSSERGFVWGHVVLGGGFTYDAESNEVVKATSLLRCSTSFAKRSFERSLNVPTQLRFILEVDSLKQTEPHLTRTLDFSVLLFSFRFHLENL